MTPDPHALDLAALPRVTSSFDGIFIHPPDTPVFTLADGRRIRLVRLHQFAVYEGKLAGLPRAMQRVLDDVITRAARLEPAAQGRVVLVPPVVVRRRGKRHLTDGTVQDQQWESWPLIACVAEFHSDRPASDDAHAYSAAVILWLQDTMSGLQPPRAAIEGLDWRAVARDWTP